MKNKKGITIGRVLLYILLCFLFLSIIWVLVLTYREIAKNPNTNTKIECENNLRLQNGSSQVYNLYDKSTLSFSNFSNAGSSNNARGWTGAFISLAPGTYSATFPSSALTNYKFAVIGSKVASLNIYGYEMLDSGWITTTTYTFTITDFQFVGLYAARSNGTSAVDVSYLNGLDYMLNEGQPHSYIDFNDSFSNASSYISSSYFVGYAKIDDSDYPYGAAWPYGYIPFRVISNSSSENGPYGIKTNYNVSTINSTTLNVGSNISSLYGDIYNATYSISYWSGYSYSNIPYSSTIYRITIYYDCSISIPVNLFNFYYVGADTLANTSCVINLTCNDNINVSIPFSNLNKFTYDLILNSNPNISTIESFSLDIYANSSIYSNITNQPAFTGDSIGIQNKSWNDYRSLCMFYLFFDNFYGSSDWNDGYNQGFIAGKNAAEESLVIAYNDAISQVNTLTSQVNDLTSRVNSQSSIIDSLQNQINNANLGFKNFFFTMADVPFKTVSNVLGFEVFGLNLFQFFTGILTALGCIWLIKKFL